MRGLIGVAAALAFSTGCTRQDSSPAPDPVGGGLPPQVAPLRGAIELSESQIALQHGATSAQFNFGRLRDLWVRVKLPAMPTVTQLHTWFINPQGERFYETTVPFTNDPSMSTMMSPNMGHPAAVYQATRLPGGYALDQQVMIAGSAFMRYPMVNEGTWIVNAQLDGAGDTFSRQMEVTVER
jgi:hypothetical protein